MRTAHRIPLLCQHLAQATGVTASALVDSLVHSMPVSQPRLCRALVEKTVSELVGISVVQSPFKSSAGTVIEVQRANFPDICDLAIGPPKGRRYGPLEGGHYGPVHLKVDTTFR